MNADEDGNLPIDFSDWRPNPEEMYKTSELRDLLIGALQELRPTLRMVFVLHDVEGFEHNEIAEMVGCSIGNSKSQLHKARLKLRDQLKFMRAEKAEKT